ncbi:hypothetical protein BCR44DRAFT_1440663 [Catenaria anguillulae PL171]|uniref:Adhesin domain-containing protein n=1 Tax=Catenaria anguillulae PL171 TaxID=765915 RepID=A0A1Y2HC99_9FUNG|nr:hypothetical protein BCR44DRAFT_1440663 [Catenaria anguillulae PL171]
MFRENRTRLPGGQPRHNVYPGPALASTSCWPIMPAHKSSTPTPSTTTQAGHGPYVYTKNVTKMTSFFRFAPATIPAVSSSWAVDPADYRDVDVQVKGNMATGRISFAGLDDPLVAASSQVPVHLVVQVDIQVSHENLRPLVKACTQLDQERHTWNLLVETPGWSELPFGMVSAGINVDVLLTFKSGRPSLDEKKQSKASGEKSAEATAVGDFVPFRNVAAHVTNLSHEFVESTLALAAQSAHAQGPTPAQANADEPPSYFAAVRVTRRQRHLRPFNRFSSPRQTATFASNPHQRVHRSAGPLRIVSSTHDAPPNPFAGSSSSLDDIPVDGGVIVKATNGRASIQVQGSSSVIASSTNGRVTLNADSCGSVAGKSTNGRVDVFTKGATRSVAANSVNGRIDVTAESVSELVEVKCVNGSVATTVLPGPSPRSLLAESTNGSVAVVAAQVVPSARIEGRSTNGKAQVTATMSEQVNTATLEGSSKMGAVRWSERAKSNPVGGSRAQLSVIREGTENQPPQSATVVGASNLSSVEVSLGDASHIRA